MTNHSWIVISQADPRPLYLQVMEQVRRRVAVGDLPAGAEVPSIRQLASGLQGSVITIKRADLGLEREGGITNPQGKGSVVAGTPKLPATIPFRQPESHLASAADLGLLLGLSKAELQKRLTAAIEQSQRGHS